MTPACSWPSARLAEYFEAVVGAARPRRDPKAAANWVINELTGRLNREGREIVDAPLSAAQLGAILDLITEGTISGKIAKDLFEIVWSEVRRRSPRDRRGARHEAGDRYRRDRSRSWTRSLPPTPTRWSRRSAKPQAIGWFVGQVMKASGGKANPQAVNEILKTKLGL